MFLSLGLKSLVSTEELSDESSNLVTINISLIKRNKISVLGAKIISGNLRRFAENDFLSYLFSYLLSIFFSKKLAELAHKVV